MTTPAGPGGSAGRAGGAAVSAAARPLGSGGSLRVATVSVGAELLVGEVIDTNAGWLAATLTALGMSVVSHRVVGDDEEVLVAAVRAAAGEADAVLVSGGLGPTSDDVTRQAIARAAGVPLVRRDDLVTWLRELFAARGRDMPVANLRQADLPRGAQVLVNRAGTAPGFVVDCPAAVQGEPDGWPDVTSDASSTGLTDGTPELPPAGLTDMTPHPPPDGSNDGPSDLPPAGLSGGTSDLPLAGSTGRTSDPPPAGSPGAARVLAPAVPVLAVPGVPSEMRRMVTEEVLPRLLALAGGPAAAVTATVRTVGVGESSVAESLADVEAALAAIPPGERPVLGYLAAEGQVRVKVTVRAADDATARAAVQPWVDRIVGSLGDLVYAVDVASDVARRPSTLDGVVVAALLAAGQTVATAESLTAGGLAAALTRTPGSSAAVRGGVVVYATDLKSTLLGVPEELIAEHGPVHPDVAAAMAVGAVRVTGATWGLALTGVAGPDEQGGRPVGEVHVGLAGLGEAWTLTVRLPGEREIVRRAAVLVALDLLRRRLAGLPMRVLGRAAVAVPGSRRSA